MENDSTKPVSDVTVPSGNLSRRRFLVTGTTAAVAGLAGVSFVAGCGSDDDSASTDESTGSAPSGSTNAGGSPATVRFWHWYTDQENQLPQVISDFEAKNPNIKVDMRILAQVESAYLPALLAAAAADDLPEIFAPHVHAIEFGKEGLSSDLIKDLGADFLKDFYPSGSSMLQSGGAQYGVGWMAQTLGLYYDPDIFAAAGIDGEPETWDDLIAASNMIKTNVSGNLGIMQAADNGFSVNDLWLPMITDITDDPEFLRQLDERGGPKWNDQPVVDSLALYKRTLDEGCWQDGQTGMDQIACLNALYTGNGAAFYSGSWNPGRIYLDGPPELVARLKVMKTPALAAGGRHWTGNSAGAAFSVANNSANKDAALTFMQYIYSTEVYAKIMSDSVSLPATISAGERVTDPIIKTMASWLPDGCRHWLTGPAGQVVADTIMQFTAGGMEPQAAADAMEAGAADLAYD